MIRGRVVIAGAAVLLLWAGFAYDVSRPADPKRYRRVLSQVAETAHDAAQTGRLVGEQQLSGRVPAPFAMSAYDDATAALAGAEKKFAAEAPPDETTAAARDRLGPLLGATGKALGDTAEARDDDARRDGVTRLGALARQLGDYTAS